MKRWIALLLILIMCLSLAQAESGIFGIKYKAVSLLDGINQDLKRYYDDGFQFDVLLEDTEGKLRLQGNDQYSLCEIQYSDSKLISICFTVSGNEGTHDLARAASLLRIIARDFYGKDSMNSFSDWYNRLHAEMNEGFLTSDVVARNFAIPGTNAGIAFEGRLSENQLDYVIALGLNDNMPALPGVETETATAAESMRELPQVTGKFYYQKNSNDHLLIYKFEADEDSPSGELVIPEEIDGYPVVGFNNREFLLDDKVLRLVLGEHLQKNRAWVERKDYLEEVVFEGDVMLDINYCSNLKTVYIGEKVNWKQSPFAACENLSRIVVSEKNENMAVIDNVLFNTTEESLIYCLPSMEQTHYTVPDGTKTIGAGAFYDAAETLEYVELPESVKEIRNGAFYLLSSDDRNKKYRSNINPYQPLVVYIPESVTTISDAFNICAGFITTPGSYAEAYAKEKGLRCEYDYQTYAEKYLGPGRPNYGYIVPYGEAISFDTTMISDGSFRYPHHDDEYENLNFTVQVKGHRGPEYFKGAYSSGWQLQGDEAVVELEVTLNGYKGKTKVNPENILEVSFYSTDFTSGYLGYPYVDAEMGGKEVYTLSSNQPTTLYKRYRRDPEAEMVYMKVRAIVGGEDHYYFFEIGEAQGAEAVVHKPTATPEPFLLKRGSKGDEVMLVQRYLKAVGFLTGTVDGAYGKQTESAVRRLQEYSGDTVTGMVDEDLFLMIYGMYLAYPNMF